SRRDRSRRGRRGSLQLPADPEQANVVAALVEAALQRGNQGVAPFLDLILDIEDFLPLATLLALQGLDLVLQRRLFLHGRRGVGTTLSVLQPCLGVVQGLFGGQQLIFSPLLELLAFGLKVGVVL